MALPVTIIIIMIHLPSPKTETVLGCLFIQDKSYVELQLHRVQRFVTMPAV